MFELGDYVVYPGHGVGQVVGIENSKTQSHQMYQVKLLSNGMKMLVPIADSKYGVRALVTKEEAENIFQILQDHNVKVDRSTWNRRQRDYQTKINTGSIVEVASVMRQLLLIKLTKKLSFSEKKVMDYCRDLLVREIALSTNSEVVDVSGRIDALIN